MKIKLIKSEEVRNFLEDVGHILTSAAKWAAIVTLVIVAVLFVLSLEVSLIAFVYGVNQSLFMIVTLFIAVFDISLLFVVMNYLFDNSSF